MVDLVLVERYKHCIHNLRRRKKTRLRVYLKSVNFKMSFWYLQFSKKNERKNSTLLLWYLKLNCFRLFWGIIEDTKKTKFEINWPLNGQPQNLVSWWPKLLNSQSMFWKSNLILGMPNFLDWTKNKFSQQEVTFWTMYKKFWHSQNEIGFPKHQLGIQKIWTLLQGDI